MQLNWRYKLGFFFMICILFNRQLLRKEKGWQGLPRRRWSFFTRMSLNVLNILQLWQDQALSTYLNLFGRLVGFPLICLQMQSWTIQAHNRNQDLGIAVHNPKSEEFLKGCVCYKLEHRVFWTFWLSSYNFSKIKGLSLSQYFWQIINKVHRYAVCMD